MNVNINFTIDVDPNEWTGRFGGAPVEVDPNDPDVVDRVSREVRAHAENVVRDLFTDMGWCRDEDPEGFGVTIDEHGHTDAALRLGDRVACGCPDPLCRMQGTVVEYPAIEPCEPPQAHYDLAMVRWDDGEQELVPTVEATPLPTTIDVSGFTRLREVDAYAARRGVDRAGAIAELVNTALSHQWELS